MMQDEAAAKAWLTKLPEADAAAMDRLGQLVAMLVEENKVQNLVSAASLDAVWLRHIVDSAQLLSHVSRETGQGAWLDLGTGAGFPGLVIAALCPNREVVMVESRARRIDWLNRVITTLDLRKASVVGQRLELVESRTVSVISARAFAPLEKLITLSARFSTSDTLWLLPKGRSAGQELAELKQTWRQGFRVEPSLTDAEAGLIVGHLNPKGVKL